MSKADEMRAKARRTRQAAQTAAGAGAVELAAAVEPVKPAPVVAATSSAAPVAAPWQVRTRPVRITTDLAPTLYDDLTAWNRQAAADLDVARVNGSDTVRALVRRLLADPALSAAVLDDLRRGQ